MTEESVTEILSENKKIKIENDKLKAELEHKGPSTPLFRTIYAETI